MNFITLFDLWGLYTKVATNRQKEVTMIRHYDKTQLPDYDDEVDDDPDLGDPFMDDEPDEPAMDWNSPYRGIEEARRHLEEQQHHGGDEYDKDDNKDDEGGGAQ